MLHPATLLVLWLSLGLMLQKLGEQALMFWSCLFVLVSLGLCAQRFFMILRRSRWILFSLFFIYAYTSQGSAVWPSLGLYSPVYEGVLSALVQLQRLISILALLSILLTLISQTQLVMGLYTLFFWVEFLGISRERIAVRLALTLRYSEHYAFDKAGGWIEKIEHLLAVPVKDESGLIELQTTSLSIRDWLIIGLSTTAMIGVWS